MAQVINMADHVGGITKLINCDCEDCKAIPEMVAREKAQEAERRAKLKELFDIRYDESPEARYRRGVLVSEIYGVRGNGFF